MKKIAFIAMLFVISLTLTACTVDVPAADTNTYKTESAQLENVQEKLIKSVQIPQLQTSQERLNIKRRAELFNTDDKVSYIYLVGYGKVMAFYTVKGKVSSLRSYMVPQEKLVAHDGGPCSVLSYSGYTLDCLTVAAPDIDGSYGENADGIFFFTTDGAYVEWVGDYMMR